MAFEAVKVVIVGAGDFGLRHIAMAAALPEMELVGIADRDAARAGAAAARFGTRAFESLESALSHVPTDAVVIATPPAAHSADILRAVHRRLPVLVEKPLVASSEELDVLTGLAQGDKTLIYPAHVSRFLPAFVALKDRVQGHRIRMIRAVRNVPAERVALHGDTHPALSAMVHDLDLVRALVNAPLEQVHTEQAWSDDSRPFPQSVVATLKFADGTLVSIDNSWTLSHSRQYTDARLEVLADGFAGSLALPGGGIRFSTADGDYEPDVDLEGSVYGVPVGALANELRHFAACVLGRTTQRAVTLDDALWSVRIALDIANQQPRR